MKSTRLFYPILCCWFISCSLAFAAQPLVLVNDFHRVRTLDSNHQTSPAAAHQSKAAKRWVEQRYGEVPKNAVVYTNNNDFTTYYCRGTYREKLYYGVLYPFIGCYITDNLSIIRLDVYEVFTG